MARSAFKLNPKLQAQWMEAISELAAIAKKDDPESVQKLVTQSAVRFVKNVVDVTPPAIGKADSAAKKRGEAKILGDLLKLAVPTTVAGSSRAAREVLSSAENLLATLEQARVGNAGRVAGRERREKLFVSNTVFNRVLAQQQALVGWLAAGLNAAADALGISLPAWIKRHGTKYGEILVQPSRHGMKIRVVQNVPYADYIFGYERRWNYALQKEVESLRKQVKAIAAKKMEKARRILRRR